jgi:hypothetical protein
MPAPRSKPLFAWEPSPFIAVGVLLLLTAIVRPEAPPWVLWPFVTVLLLAVAWLAVALMRGGGKANPDQWGDLKTLEPIVVGAGCCNDDGRRGSAQFRHVRRVRRMNTLARRRQLIEAARRDVNPPVALFPGKPERSVIGGAGFQHDLVTWTCFVERALEIAVSWNRNEPSRPAYFRGVNSASRARRCLRRGIARRFGLELDPWCLHGDETDDKRDADDEETHGSRRSLC